MISIAKAGEPSCSLQTVLCGLVAHNARLSKMGKSQSCGLKSEVPKEYFVIYYYCSDKCVILVLIFWGHSTHAAPAIASY